MKVWICNQCSAEIAQEQEPKTCPLCNQHNRGFEEGQRKDPSDEDKKYSKIYEEIVKDLEDYDEGCEPKDLKFSCEC